jgi:hypothetical protein
LVAVVAVFGDEADVQVIADAADGGRQLMQLELVFFPRQHTDVNASLADGANFHGAIITGQPDAFQLGGSLFIRLPNGLAEGRNVAPANEHDQAQKKDRNR